MTELLTDPQTYISLITLTGLEIVLGVDNILFISIVSNLLPPNQRTQARRLGLGLALFGRLALLFSLGFVLSLKEPLLTAFGHGFSGRDLVLGLGGLFLIYKSTQEIFWALEGTEHGERKVRVVSFRSAIFQIVMLDIVFSLDSIITAIGLVDQVAIMAVAVVISVIIMLLFSQYISEFLDRHPSMKMLGLAFLFLVAVMLVAESLGTHVPKPYIYFALGFSLAVEVVNIRVRKLKDKA
jgi:predicted tellurium resistance membrane protein TerC